MFMALQSTRKLVLASVVLLAGCQVGGENIEDWSDIPEAKKATASRVYNVHDVLFAANGATLNESEGRRLELFVRSVNLGQSDQVYVVPGRGSMARRRQVTVSDFLAARNISINPSPETAGVGGPPTDAVSVIISRYVVSLPGCPDWTGERTTYNNVPTSNWGCASAINLGRMVARPEDLVRGRRPGPFDGELGARSIDLYRKGETKPLTLESVGPIEAQQQSSGSSSGGAGQ